MRPHHFLLGFLIAVVWGVNFIFIHIGLQELPPLLLCGLRFFFSSIPAVFFIKKPDVPLKWLLAYGIFTFGFQFAFLFMGMHAGMTPGLSSIVAQTQVFFSLFVAAMLLKEKLSAWHMTGAVIAFSGIGMIGFHLEGQSSSVGFIFILIAAAAWGLGNYFTKKMGKVNAIALVVWGSLIALPFLMFSSLLFEGTTQMMHGIQHMTWSTLGAIFYIVVISTWFGYGAWNWLLTKYPLSSVAPFTLLVPIVGILSASWLFGEPMQPWKKSAAVLVISGLCINSLGPKLLTTRLWQRVVSIISPVTEKEV